MRWAASVVMRARSFSSRVSSGAKSIRPLPDEARTNTDATIAPPDIVVRYSPTSSPA